MPDALGQVVHDFAEHYHDEWAMAKIDAGWTIGRIYDEEKKDHPNLRNFNALHENVSGEVPYSVEILSFPLKSHLM